MDDERPVIIFLIFVAVVAWIFVISSFAESYKNIPHEKLVTVHDTPSNELREIEAPCKECGQMTFGINGEITCRNKECPLYSVPVKVNE